MKKTLNCIDLFAGAGGFTTGAIQAGLKVLWSANHWREAVDVHQVNHPKTIHTCQDLHQADWSQVPIHQILLASPACQGHSIARGGDSPHHDLTRSTAWSVVSCAEFHQPEFIVVENVPEFLKWKLYRPWKMALESLGYSITENILNASSFGVGQDRVRVFIVCAKGNQFRIDIPNIKAPTARNIIDFNHAKWSPVNKTGRSEKTLKVIANGRKNFGNRFLVPYYGRTENGRSLDRPIGTLTTRDRYAVIDGDRMRMLTVDETRKFMAFPKNYILPKVKAKAIHMLGNAVCPPVVKEILNQIKIAA